MRFGTCRVPRFKTGLSRQVLDLGRTNPTADRNKFVAFGRKKGQNRILDQHVVDGKTMCFGFTVLLFELNRSYFGCSSYDMYALPSLSRVVQATEETHISCKFSKSRPAGRVFAAVTEPASWKMCGLDVVDQLRATKNRFATWTILLIETEISDRSLVVFGSLFFGGCNVDMVNITLHLGDKPQWSDCLAGISSCQKTDRCKHIPT